MSWIRWVQDLVGSSPAAPACRSIPNRNHSGRRSSTLWIVLHATEGGSRAFDVATWMASTRPPKPVSAHRVVDEFGNCAMSVDDDLIVWGAGVANSKSLQIEMVTPRGASLKWKAGEWVGKGELLQTAAGVVADWCRKYDIPVRFIEAAELLRGEKGIVTHAEVSEAFQGGKGHFDPGPGFPMYTFLDMVRARLE